MFSASRLVHNMWTQHYSIVEFIAVLETQSNETHSAYWGRGARSSGPASCPPRKRLSEVPIFANRLRISVNVEDIRTRHIIKCSESGVGM